MSPEVTSCLENTMSLTRLLKEKKGATSIEYGLIAALISVAAMNAIHALGKQTSEVFESTTNKMQTVISK